MAEAKTAAGRHVHIVQHHSSQQQRRLIVLTDDDMQRVHAHALRVLSDAHMCAQLEGRHVILSKDVRLALRLLPWSS